MHGSTFVAVLVYGVFAVLHSFFLSSFISTSSSSLLSKLQCQCQQPVQHRLFPTVPTQVQQCVMPYWVQCSWYNRSHNFELLTWQVLTPLLSVCMYLACFTRLQLSIETIANLLSSVLTILLTCPNSDTLLCYCNNPVYILLYLSGYSGEQSVLYWLLTLTLKFAE